MGECVPLGYEVKERNLVVNKKETPIIKLIYDKFLETESYFLVTDLLNKAGYRTKVRNLKTGQTTGGGLFQQNAVLHILRNPYYKGCVTHKGQVYPGKHEAIISEEQWNRVQEIFNKNGNQEKRTRKYTPALLTGLIRCGCCDVPMSVTCCVKKTKRYRYYACSRQLKYKTCPSEHKSVPARLIEEQVVNDVIRILRSPEILVHVNKLAEMNSGKLWTFSSAQYK